ncbi:glycosyltransferase 61 family protein [Temperatibacter marinus]|uniref:Glycosyltransferase 61 family protein n=1 Tax=Temperatibacter marinus TaxID=1456591 RepID=A0AA52EIM6_9PROT|nr:glycosyltransferase 61 family protein [Temperatibacter marinus]WND03199.1 glycosyltransferase 61 family protein [Temperatibacter marinus]
MEFTLNNSHMLEQAIAVPCYGAENGPVLPGVKGGIFTKDMESLPSSLLYREYTSRSLKNKAITRASSGKINRIMDPYPLNESELENIAFIEGECIYGGLLFSHFGHFILESLARLWYIKKHPSLKIIWLSAHQQKTLSDYQKAILDLLGIKNEIVIVTEICRIEKLHCPDAGFLIQSKITPEQQQALYVTESKNLVSGKKVWLSRASATFGKVYNETLLEPVLKENGWLIYEPEKHSVGEQIEFLKDAEHIAGVGGSAFHLLVFIKNYQGKVSLFPRGLSLSGNYYTIAESLNLNQTEYFIPSLKWSHDQPSWRANWIWKSLDPLLKILDIPETAPQKPGTLSKPLRDFLASLEGLVDKAIEFTLQEPLISDALQVKEKFIISEGFIRRKATLKATDSFFSMSPIQFMTLLDKKTQFDALILPSYLPLEENIKVVNAVLSHMKPSSFILLEKKNDAAEKLCKFIYDFYPTLSVDRIEGLEIYLITRSPRRMFSPANNSLDRDSSEEPAYERIRCLSPAKALALLEALKH